jgi:hypothetical protein
VLALTEVAQTVELMAAVEQPVAMPAQRQHVTHQHTHAKPIMKPDKWKQTRTNKAEACTTNTTGTWASP